MAGAHLLKKPSDWSSLATGVEINPDGSGFRLKQGHIDDFNDGSLDSVFTAVTGGSGSVVEASNKLAIISPANADVAMIEYDAGLDLSTLENYIELKFAVGAESIHIMNLFNPGTSFPIAGGATANGVWLQFLNSPPTTLIMNGLTGGGTPTGSVSITIVLNTTYVAKFWITSTQLVYQLWNEAKTVMLGGGAVDLSLTQKSSDSPQLIFGDARNNGWTCDIEIFDLTIEDGIFSSSSPVATMGVVALPVGFIVNGLGDLVEKLDGTAGISPAYNINDVGFTAPGTFSSYGNMDAFLNANPITITDPINSADIQHSHDSDSTEQAEVFVCEGPNLTGGGGGGGTSPIFGGGIFQA